MHEHDHDQADRVTGRPKSARLDEPESARQLRAALSGRLDAAGPVGLLRLQRTAGNAGSAALVAGQEEAMSPVHDVIRGPGEPLPVEVRADMESRLGHDFGDVRVHTDGAAEASAQAVNASAYTVGSHIAFQRTAYDPGSDQGRTTLAHELTHVVQQRTGPVDGAVVPGGIRVSDPSDRFEREAAATAAQAVAAPAIAAPAPTSAGPLGVQREEAAAPEEQPEEAPVQGTFLQREEAGEEPEEAPVQGMSLQREDAEEEPAESPAG